MELSEMTKLPTKAGKAVLKLAHKYTYPELANGTITLPKWRGNKFFPLRRGRQFLFVDNTVNNTLSAFYWFGGTDEQPFLTEVTKVAAEALIDGGEAAFFAALKPQTIHDLEKKLHAPSRRQGDIFIMPLPFGWDALQRSLDDFGIRVEDKELVAATEVPVFGTSHVLTGKILDDVYHDSHGEPVIIASGRLTAPNHRARRLKGPNLLMQAVNIKGD
ncbi:hypothetical protein HY491_02345 [Candidatus Woesearchaeota archaeon]|nr:hypothetical protein [Candidatus Woesearchaeota archaeon]